MKEAERIVYFDGVCGLCNRSVDFIIRRKHVNRFRFAPLQGTTAKDQLEDRLLEEMDSVIYQRDGIVYTESSAALYILRDLGGFWPLLFVFIILPAFIRNGIYHWVARNRYTWFGKKESCRLPSPEERAYFLP